MDRPPDHGHVMEALDDRRRKGAEWRRQVPLGAHAEWKAPADRTDPVEILIGQGSTRIAELLPIRYARMKTDPFAFLRGAAAIMAADLAHGPTTGIRVQACGDCHLANFGAYATPEGNPVFDVNDFDETLPAPFRVGCKTPRCELRRGRPGCRCYGPGGPAARPHRYKELSPAPGTAGADVPPRSLELADRSGRRHCRYRHPKDPTHPRKAARCRATGRRRALRSRRTEERRLEDPRKAATGAPFEPSRASCASGLCILCRDIAGGSAGPVT